ncbi:MAG: LamG-like jellyroll fold domain-containing protein [Verrucomicrobiales bacterium]
MKLTTQILPAIPRAAAALVCLLPAWATAAVTPYSWLRGGESGIGADSSGQNPAHPFNAAFSSGCEAGAGGGGLSTAITTTNAVGGPLGTTGAVSGVASRWGFFNCGNSGMWIQGPNNTVPPPEQWSLPATNWVMECWMMPVDTGATRQRTDAQFMSTGSGHFGGRPGGAAFRTRFVTDDQGNGAVEVRCDAIGPGPENNFTIGDPIIVSTERWTHIAVVNDNGVTTFYVNGVASGTPSDIVSAPSGVPYIGSGQDTGGPYNGFLDEMRYSTFTAGQFVIGDLLLRPPGPGFISQPQSASVWDGGAAPFEAVMVQDPDNTFQWKRNNADIANATAPEYVINTVTAADSGSVFALAATLGAMTTTTPDATLTVVPQKTEDNAFFRAAIEAEASLLGFWPVDSFSGSTVTNTKDNTRHATLQGVAYFDGRTARSYGQRAIRLRGQGEAVIPANPAYEFSDGTGTIEALVYLENPGAQHPKTIFSIAGEEGALYYAFQAAPDGNSLIYKNESLPLGVSWSVNPGLLNRLAHVALVFSATQVTAYVDGVSLGAKDNPQFGPTPGLPARIGSAGLDVSGNPIEPWNGSIDEVAIYGDALSANTIAVHNSRFIFGTAVTAPTIESSPTGTWNLLSGGAPIFQVRAVGTAPLSYQWKRDGQPVTGNATATTSTFTILGSTAAASGTYTVTVSNPVNEVTSPPFTVNFTDPPAGDRYAGFVLADGPTSYWRLNEAEGTTVMKDYAGGYDGTYTPPRVTLGIEAGFGIAPDTAAQFNAGGVAALVPYTPIHNPTSAFSVEFWAKPAQSGNVQRAIIATQNRDIGRSGYAIYQGFNGAWWEAHLGTGETVMFLQGASSPVAGRWDHIVMTWNGSNLAALYVNGVVERTESTDTSGRPVRNNTVRGLEIGSRFGGTLPYNGVIDEVAFYNYALTPAQIEKHYSVAYFPSSITTQPTPVPNGMEQDTITLAATVTGFPNTYQWFKDGAALEGDETNPDGSPKYPQGVAGSTLVISQSLPADSGSYRLVITNPLGGSQTDPVAVNVAPDTTPPVLTSVSAMPTLNRVQLVFNKPMLASSLTTLGNYTFTGGLTPTAVTLTTDPRVFTITTTGMNASTVYAITVTGVRDDRINQNLIQPTTRDFTAFVETTGRLAWDYYRGIDGGAVADLTGDPQFPAGVWTTRFLNRFSTMDITPGNALDNNPEFGPALGNKYGARIYGWVTPTETANYQFFLRSDDASELWISSDASPTNANIAAFEPTCCRAFLESGDVTSTLITLTARQRYYIEVLYKEGGGGDYAEVAWRKEGDTTPAAQLTPIPGQFLSTYAPVPVGPIDIQINGAIATISWNGAGLLQRSADLVTWTTVTGAASPYVITLTPGDPPSYFRQRVP